jgi:hypothetical protein
MLNFHHRFDRLERALFWEPWKLVASTKGKKELYDFVHDPNEKDNRYETDKSVVQELSARMDQMLKTSGEEFGQPARLDKRAIDRLRSLGYVQ